MSEVDWDNIARRMAERAVNVERQRIAEAVRELPDAYGHGVAVLRHSVLAIIEGTTDE